MTDTVENKLTSADPQFVSKMLETRRDRFEQALTGKAVEPAAFMVAAISEINASNELRLALEESPTTVLNGIMSCALMGLEPGKTKGHFYLTPRRVKGQWTCLPIVGYRGFQFLAMSACDLDGRMVKNIVADVVYAHEEKSGAFRYTKPCAEHPYGNIHHEAASLLDDIPDQSKLAGAYAKAIMANGDVIPFVYSKAQIEKRRACADSWKSEGGRKYSPWSKWPEEMWKKTAILGLCRSGLLALGDTIKRAVEATETEAPDGIVDETEDMKVADAVVIHEPTPDMSLEDLEARALDRDPLPPSKDESMQLIAELTIDGDEPLLAVMRSLGVPTDYSLDELGPATLAAIVDGLLKGKGGNS